MQVGTTPAFYSSGAGFSADFRSTVAFLQPLAMGPIQIVALDVCRVLVQFPLGSVRRLLRIVLPGKWRKGLLCSGDMDFVAPQVSSQSTRQVLLNRL